MESVDSAADLLAALATGLAKAQSFCGLHDSKIVNAAVDAESVRRVDDDDETRLEASGTLRVRCGIEADGEWSESAATEPVVYRVMFRPTAPAHLPARASAIAHFLGTQDGSDELRLRSADGRVPDLVVTWRGNVDDRHVAFEVVPNNRRH